ncbi:MAG: hypothetical protein CM1200mP34_3170 [Verrucomicrobiales bacterium]|nr:MAG: hypothetical protein CM1200mP34_3170 [Verrucomicrobiales bacterium]
MTPPTRLPWGLYRGLCLRLQQSRDPAAPNSADNSTRGVRISVNNNDDTSGSEAMGVNLFPAEQNFSGNYAVRFDMWINYKGRPGAAPAPRSTPFSE